MVWQRIKMLKKKNKEYLNLFPVPIQLAQTELNIDSLIEFCYEMKRKNEKGVEISNVGGWQSNNIINETHTEFVKLKTEIDDAVKVYHEDVKFKKTIEQKISNIWININQKGHSNGYHVHARATLSGAFYLTKVIAPIVFQHPFHDITQYYWDSFLIEEWNETNSGEWRLVSEPNTLIIFPAWLYHKVLMSKEDTDRISLSFNTYHRSDEAMALKMFH